MKNEETVLADFSTEATIHSVQISLTIIYAIHKVCNCSTEAEIKHFHPYINNYSLPFLNNINARE